VNRPGLGEGFDRRYRRHHGASSLRQFRNLREICPQGEFRTLHDVTTKYSWVMNMDSLLEQGCAGAVDLGLDLVPDEASIDLAAALIAEAGRTGPASPSEPAEIVSSAGSPAARFTVARRDMPRFMVATRSRTRLIVLSSMASMNPRIRSRLSQVHEWGLRSSVKSRSCHST
jgi:hypothetical protein